MRFEQTAGGRTGVPAPRRVNRPPYVQVSAPLAWTTLQLTLHADGRQEHRLIGASPFPRHWVYDANGRLEGKSATIDYREWSTEVFGDRTPWGCCDSPVLVSAVETALEREMSLAIMRSGERPKIRRLAAGEHLTEQGEEADELYLLLDGLLQVEVDGNVLSEIGPGAVLGERAMLEHGRRTATLRGVDTVRRRGRRTRRRRRGRPARPGCPAQPGGRVRPARLTEADTPPELRPAVAARAASRGSRPARARRRARCPAPARRRPAAR